MTITVDKAYENGTVEILPTSRAQMVKALQELRKDQPGVTAVHVDAPIGVTGDFVPTARTLLGKLRAKFTTVPEPQPTVLKADGKAACEFCDKLATGDTDPPTCDDHKGMKVTKADLQIQGLLKMVEHGEATVAELTRLLAETRDDLEKATYRLPVLKMSDVKLLNGEVTIIKSAPMRYTLSPLYLPNSVDAHGDWTHPDDLQKAVWGLMESDDRNVNLQHMPGTVAGRRKDLVTWPWEHDATLSLPTGEVRKARMPANTPYMGVVWNEDAWVDVQAGRLRGLSMEGTAQRVMADLPGLEAA